MERNYRSHEDHNGAGGGNGDRRREDLPVNEDDPEKRIAALERRLADTNWAASEDVPGSRPPDTGIEQLAQRFSTSAPFPGHPAGGQTRSQGTPSIFWQPQSRRRYGAVLIPGIVLLVVAGFALALVLHFKPLSSGLTQLHTAEGLSGLLDEIRNHFGDTMGYGLTVHPNYAIIHRADPQDNRAEQSYHYRSGDWSDFGDPSPASGELTDLSKFDPAGVPATLATAAQTLTIPHPKYTYLLVESDGGTLSLAIHVSDRVSGWMSINADGTIKELYPPS